MGIANSEADRDDQAAIARVVLVTELAIAYLGS